MDNSDIKIDLELNFRGKRYVLYHIVISVPLKWDELNN